MGARHSKYGISGQDVAPGVAGRVAPRVHFVVQVERSVGGWDPLVRGHAFDTLDDARSWRDALRQADPTGHYRVLWIGGPSW